MNLLIDTHALIWFAEDDRKLSKVALAEMENPKNSRWVSVASIWEMAIKISLGKLAINGGLTAFRRRLESNGFDLLTVTAEHAESVADLPFHHRDPFDRLLVAQSKRSQMSFVSHDETLDAYGILRVW